MAGRGRHVVVIGGGMAGLAAASELLRRPDPPRVSLFEAADRVGGKVRGERLAGLDLDVGADAMLARVPEGTDLAREVGLADAIVHPVAQEAFLWTRGRLRPLPQRTVLGVPTSLASLATSGAVSPAGLARAALDLLGRSGPRALDGSVAELVGGRLGDEVVEAVVEPLLGGIYAGRADHLGVQATVPEVAAVLAQGGSLIRGLAARLPAAQPDAPVFAGLDGGMAKLPAALASCLETAGAEIHLNTRVTSLARSKRGWRVNDVAADAVVVATPAAASAELLEEHAPAAAQQLRAIVYADVGIVSLVYRRRAHAGEAPGSGFLVPAREGRLIKACTWSSAKWARLADEHLVVRCSVGRAGDSGVLAMSDDDLVRAVHAELVVAVAMDEPPTDSLVTRWYGALPQYDVGHLDRVAEIEAVVAGVDGLEVAGAAYRGVGIPAVIRSGRAAARRVMGQ